jgi:flavin reductase (DIM6/NTAB) family NADH-FMN oxidoreductase RutF
MKKQVKLEQLINLFPCPVVLVSSKLKEKENVLTLAWVGIVCSVPPTISISIRPQRFSHGLIKKTKQFVLNVPSKELLEKVDKAGSISGKGIDKFEKFGLEKEKGFVVDAAMLKECPISLECKVKKTIPLGSHDLFIAEIVSANVDESLLGENNQIDFAKLQPIVLLGREYRSLGEKLAEYGYSARK